MTQTATTAEHQAILAMAPADRPWLFETERARDTYPDLKAAERVVLSDVRRSYTPEDMSDEEALETAADTDRRFMDDTDGLEPLYLAYVRVMDAQFDPGSSIPRLYGIGAWSA